MSEAPQMHNDESKRVSEPAEKPTSASEELQDKTAPKTH